MLFLSCLSAWDLSGFGAGEFEGGIRCRGNSLPIWAPMYFDEGLAGGWPGGFSILVIYYSWEGIMFGPVEHGTE